MTTNTPFVQDFHFIGCGNVISIDIFDSLEATILLRGLTHNPVFPTHLPKVYGTSRILNLSNFESCQCPIGATAWFLKQLAPSVADREPCNFLALAGFVIQH